MTNQVEIRVGGLNPFVQLRVSKSFRMLLKEFERLDLDPLRDLGRLHWSGGVHRSWIVRSNVEANRPGTAGRHLGS